MQRPRGGRLRGVSVVGAELSAGGSGRKSVRSGEGGWGADPAGVLSHGRESDFYSEWI